MHKFANPARFMRLSSRLLPWLIAATIGLLAVGSYMAWFASPPDYQQGETVRIMYVHVPSAWLAMGGYTFIALASAVYLIWTHPLADVLARSTAPIGAAFAFITLVTGAIWGKPTWGAWWVWDARLTSMLVLFFLYVGYIALNHSMPEVQRNGKIPAILALVGVINIPIIKFSVEWWNTLHQPASVFRAGGPTIDASMLWPLGLMAGGMSCLFAVLVMLGARTFLMQQKLRRLQFSAK